ncbi:Putative beta-barrel porin 2 [Marisediminitalea aggregata]|uniref:Putative beta-barrel porin 2 n=1 Tax=Marisediminitalea aggregata TaxID=634436 RepID=A0A1M5HF42_9ALTE|nr:outer membrane beta-barrel protein [Marisediminitalea aggregata]SHG14541.1 Putative beta-barrel porin 2 [Marisediminitalea aggregata]
MLHNKIKFLAVSLALTSTLNIAQAEEIDRGFSGKIDSSVVYDDNIYRLNKDLAKDDTYFNLSPTASLIGGFGKHVFKLNYVGDYAKFSNESDADFYDHDFRGLFEFDHTSKLNSKFEAGYQYEHEDPGTINRVQLDITEYNKYSQNYVAMSLSYGRIDSTGRVTAEYKKTERDYKNNSSDFLDFSGHQILTRFNYRVAARTRLYLELLKATYDYKEVLTFQLDNSLNLYRAGVAWDFTNKLSGDINVGYQDRDYDQPDIQDISGLAYSGNVNWSINTYTDLKLNAIRESIDSSLEQTGGFLRTTYGIDFSHKLTPLVKINLKSFYINDQLVFSSQREDKRKNFEFNIEYKVSHSFEIASYYIFEKRDSTFSLAEFEANTIGLSFNLLFGN